MAVEPKGATYGDAIIAAITFAREQPLRFLLTIPLTMACIIVLLALWLRFGVSGPIGNLAGKYKAVREKSHRPREPRLPFDD